MIERGSPTPPTGEPGAAETIRPYLEEREHVLHAESPDETLMARRDPRLVAVGLFWVLVAGAGFWGFSATFLGDEYRGLPVALRTAVLLLAAAPFVVVAWFTLHGHVGMRRRAARRTVYAVTNRRVVALAPALRIAGRLRLDSIPLASARWVDPDGEGPVPPEVVDTRNVVIPIVLLALRDPGPMRDALRSAQRGHGAADARE